eukprot:gene13310-9537_t
MGEWQATKPGSARERSLPGLWTTITRWLSCSGGSNAGPLSILGFVDPFTKAADEADPTVNERTSHSVSKNIQLRLLADLTQHHMDAKRAWLLSAAFGGSGKWLISASASGKYYGPYRFRPEEFLEALRLRCLLHPLPHNPNAGDPCTCVCGKDITRELTLYPQKRESFHEEKVGVHDLRRLGGGKAKIMPCCDAPVVLRLPFEFRDRRTEDHFRPATILTGRSAIADSSGVEDVCGGTRGCVAEARSQE